MTDGIEYDGEDMFVIRNGVRIARREDRKWVSMKPGLTVLDTDGGRSITIEYSPAPLQ